MNLVTSSFCWHHAVTLTFDLLQDQRKGPQFSKFACFPYFKVIYQKTCQILGFLKIHCIIIKHFMQFTSTQDGQNSLLGDLDHLPQPDINSLILQTFCCLHIHSKKCNTYVKHVLNVRFETYVKHMD